VNGGEIDPDELRNHPIKHGSGRAAVDNAVAFEGQNGDEMPLILERQ